MTWFLTAVRQFRFRTRKILWLGSYAVPLPYNKFSTTWSFAVPLPYKSFDFKSRSSASAQRMFCDWKFRNITSAQGMYYVSKFSSSAFAHRTICDLNFHSSASARKDVIWNSALLLLHENISFLWKIHSHSTTHPFLTWLMDPLKDRETKESGCSWQKSSFGCARHKLMTYYVHTGTVRDRVARQASCYDRESFIMLTHLRQRFWTATVSTRC